MSILRRDIIWWKHHGQWPSAPLRYRNHYSWAGETLDGIGNLEMATDLIDRKYPFVSQYRPRGRENNMNYGRWVYQRRYAFKLVRVGYWDSPEEAAREGIKLWKEKTKSVTGESRV